MDWGTALWDQHDAIEKHTQSGLDLVERYVKFVKERSDIEQNYAKQLRGLCKKYARRGSKEDQETKFTNHRAFQEVVNELNNYAGQREQLAENMSLNICVELTKYMLELKLERKTLLSDVKKAQQNLETSFKQLEMTKKRFEKEWKEVEKANQQVERVEQDPTSSKLDVDKAKQNAHIRVHAADECKNEYAAQLQKYNKEQNNHYHNDIPGIYNKLQEVDEKRIKKLAEGYGLFADTERKILPTISMCLDNITTTSTNTNERQDSMTFIDQHKSGLAPPVDVEFEDYSQGIRSGSVENQSNHFNHSKSRNIKLLFKKNKAGTQDKHMPPPVEDFSHLPPDQRKKRLQEKIDEIKREMQKEMDKSAALSRMRGVYEQNSQLGDPSSLEPQINQISHNIIAYIKRNLCVCVCVCVLYLPVTESSPVLPEPVDDIYDEFEEFEDFEDDVPIAQCLALYSFDGSSEGAVSMQAGEKLKVMDEDHGDGWVRVKRDSGDEGYVPASYIKIIQ
ncbi:hypothetical protein AMEX_G24786 [Astyanax mexicanus]|uniref:Thyroid hormone receptor interactor 10b n=1 Tax=Astyanax mexicanus TaxID=7994 RepID=A0A8T2KV85_ASTMX|nr:hypothetical protein AMEX_G24786 [Astyanax mexicanus]